MPWLARSRPLLVLGLLVAFASPAWAEVCNGSKVKKADLTVYDQAVVLSQAESDQAIQTHLPYGTPQCPRLLPHREYIVCYDLDHRVPRWAAYTLTSADLGPARRLDAFRTDPRLTTDESAHCDDYKGSGYDRGHNVPRCDMNRSPMVQANTYFFSNMSPQRPVLNRGMWRWLEDVAKTAERAYTEPRVSTMAAVQSLGNRVADGASRAGTTGDWSAQAERVRSMRYEDWLRDKVVYGTPDTVVD